MQTKQTKKLFEEWYADYLKEEINPLEKIYLNKLSIKEGKAYVKQEREKLNKAFLAGQSQTAKEIFKELDKWSQDYYALDMNEFINSYGGRANPKGYKGYLALKAKHLKVD